jgi:hypothetical protein
MGRIWTKEEDIYLRANYSKTDTQQMCNFLKRSERSIYSRAIILNLKKDRTFIQEVCRKNAERNENFKKTQFRKGQEPVNKGKKLSEDVRKKLEPTMFKKGHTPKNSKKDNEISIRKDNRGVSYLFIRISKGDWKPLQRVVWEKFNGKIPEGRVVTFKDGNTFNCKIENLECLNRDELMTRNSIHRFPKELKDTIRVLGKLKKELKKYNL